MRKLRSPNLPRSRENLKDFLKRVRVSNACAKWKYSHIGYAKQPASLL